MCDSVDLYDLYAPIGAVQRLGDRKNAAGKARRNTNAPPLFSRPVSDKRFRVDRRPALFRPMVKIQGRHRFLPRLICLSLKKPDPRFGKFEAVNQLLSLSGVWLKGTEDMRHRHMLARDLSPRPDIYKWSVYDDLPVPTHVDLAISSLGNTRAVERSAEIAVAEKPPMGDLV